jgi:hypothetical protein
MENPNPIPRALLRQNIYALLALIGGLLAFIGNCFTLLSIIIPGLPFVCGTISGIFSLLALVLGIVGLVQIKKSGEKGRGMALAGLLLGVLGVISACAIALAGTTLWAVYGPEIATDLGLPIP